MVCSLGSSGRVAATVVVVLEVVGEVSSESGDGQFDVSDEGRFVTLVQDGALDPFGFPVRLGTSSSYEPVFDPEACERVTEQFGSELVAVICGDGFRGESPSHQVGSYPVR